MGATGTLICSGRRSHGDAQSRPPFESGVSGVRLTSVMPSSESEAAIRRAVRRRHQGLATDLVNLRRDAGVSRTRLAAEAGVDRRYLDRIEAGEAQPSMETYQRLAAALGADLSTRLYPNTGPTLRDRHQAPMLELLLTTCHPRWVRYTEVGVSRPARGWVDAVLAEPREHVAVASELQSDLRRLEQLVRWQAMKAESLPSWEGWGMLGEVEPTVSRLLVVRRTRSTRRSPRSSAGSCAPPTRRTRTTPSRR